LAANNKNKRIWPVESGHPDQIPTVAEASQRRDDLLSEARALQSAGKIRQARRRWIAAQEMQHRLTALETEIRLSHQKQRARTED
jgi:hypothetical protein